MSDYAVTVVIGAVTFCVAAYFLNSRRRSYTLPVGPPGVPLYGNLLEIKRSAAEGPGLLNAWGKKYGEIYSLRLGYYDAVVLNSPRVIREALVEHADATSGRPINVFFFKRIVGKAGIIMNEGEEWKSLRRAALRAMRDFGMGKNSLEQRIHEEAHALVEEMEAQKDSAFDPKLMLHNAFSNVICSIVFGKRYDYKDEEFITMANCLNYAFKAGGFRNPEMFVPMLTLVMPLTNRSFFKATKYLFQLEHIIKEKIQKGKEDFDPDDIRSFIDIYLKAERDGELENKHAEKNMLLCIFDLFVAGSETSSTSLRWALLYFLHYPRVQTKCQEEIKREIGTVRPPTNSDRIKLPYIEATIFELQRICTIAASGVLHRTTAPVRLAGYDIPENILLLPNLHGGHVDPEYWGDPEVLRPERWIGEDGHIIKHDHFMNFSVGPRECLGKSLALQEIFIVLVSLLQKFRFCPKDPDNLPKIKGEVGLTYVPDDFEVVLERL